MVAFFDGGKMVGRKEVWNFPCHIFSQRKALALGSYSMVISMWWVRFPWSLVFPFSGYLCKSMHGAYSILMRNWEVLFLLENISKNKEKKYFKNNFDYPVVMQKKSKDSSWVRLVPPTLNSEAV